MRADKANVLLLYRKRDQNIRQKITIMHCIVDFNDFQALTSVLGLGPGLAVSAGSGNLSPAAAESQFSVAADLESGHSISNSRTLEHYNIIPCSHLNNIITL